jgi:hypothetical protein
MNKEVTLPSGATLKMTTAPFSDAKALYMAVAEEMTEAELNLKFSADLTSEVDLSVIKDLFCTALSSKKIDQALAKCMERALYEGKRCSDTSTWEPVAAREDYLDVLAEVARHNLNPFGKSLSRLSSSLLGMIGVSPRSGS